MKTAEPLLYALNVIWLVEDLFWLAIAMSFDFLFTCTYLERLAGCFSSMCRFRFAVDDVWNCFLRPGGQCLHKKVRFFPPGSSLTFFIKLFYVIIQRCRINGGGGV